MEEIWREVDGSNGDYLVSSHGSVKSRKFDKCGKLLKPRLEHKGYLSIKINRRQYKIHRLVAFAFIPNPENKPQVNHIDGDKQNNHYSNLEWCTGLENARHAWRTSLQKKRFGEKAANSKLSDATRQEMADKHASGSSLISLSKEYSITSTQVLRIVKQYGTHRPNVARYTGEELRAHKRKILRDWYRRNKMTTEPRPYRILRENERNL